ncbi:MAG: hypothetical protein ACOY35_03500 [Bacillota bacterium]
MIKSAEFNLPFPAVTQDISVETNQLSVTEEVMDWLEQEDTATTKRIAIGFCSMSGFFFAAQLIRFLFS